MTLHQIDKSLAAFRTNRPSGVGVRHTCEAVLTLKATAVKDGDQDLAKTLWTREQSLEAQALYLNAFDELRAGRYYDAWCTFERCEIILLSLREHVSDELWSRFSLDFVATQTKRFQSAAFFEQ